ncbi:uncharacterized protein LOC129774698 [Toxorhynchites rutilus septentrionalis]|uniref:uncharacterized protein LOC129774698 n=1 Tax=Toxorhynchites rutilus septentrionalis TaxID=329112 RepID=UPI00247A5EAB|nr:uncharacterized protein LOC129774698 [Toxorhynchites rutilus septentrionalis]
MSGNGMETFHENPANMSTEFDNQMQRDFCDPAFNRYDKGPGADLDDGQQPGAIAAAAAATTSFRCYENGMSCKDPLAVKIRLKNTADLTENGLRELCRPYGTVMNVYKPRQGNGNYAFVEFANQSEAGFAIQELNQKLGFNFYPAFAREKKSVAIEAPPPPFEATSNEKLTQTLETNGEESWETTLATRRIKTGFSIPLKIKYPVRKSLATAPHYVPRPSTITALSRVDADQIFNVVTMVENTHRRSTRMTDAKIQERNKIWLKRTSVHGVTPVGKFNDRTLYGYTSLPEEQSRLFTDTKCVACGYRGFFNCSTCGTPYCSKYCQQQDYQTHKTLCHLECGSEKIYEQEKNRKVSFEDLEDACLVQEVFSKGTHVTIVAVLSADRVFVRALEKESNREYLQTVSDIAKTGIGAEDLNGIPQAGDICLAYYEPLGVYGRVLITNISKRQAHCVFIEFGLIKLFDIQHLKQLKDNKLKYKKVRIHKIHLKDITDEYGHIERAMSYLNDLIDQPLEMKSQLEGCNQVDALLRTAEGISVNKEINRLITIPTEQVAENSESFVDYKEVLHKQLPINQEVDVVILNRTTIKLDFRVTLIAYDDLFFLEDLQKKLQSYGKKVDKFTEHYTPRLNEVCLVRNMDTWYRGVCLESVGDGRPSVFLCDFGCLVMAKLEDIRKIPSSLVQEVRTNDAKIFGLEEAQKAGVNIDSEFLDIYLEENERLTVQTSEEMEFKEFEGLLTAQESAMLTVIKVPDLEDFIGDRVDCG